VQDCPCGITQRPSAATRKDDNARVSEPSAEKPSASGARPRRAAEKSRPDHLLIDTSFPGQCNNRPIGVGHLNGPRRYRQTGSCARSETSRRDVLRASVGRIDRSSQGCRCALRSDRPKQQRMSLRASVGYDRRAQALTPLPPIRTLRQSTNPRVPDPTRGEPNVQGVDAGGSGHARGDDCDHMY
jgi:hypothetical protein